MSTTKEQAYGKWESILSAYIPKEFLQKKHGPCPLCAGVDRFRYDDKKGNGEYFCSGCGAGSGIHLLAQYQDCTHLEAWRLVEKVIGTATTAPQKDKVDQLARVKNILSTCTTGTENDFVTKYMLSRGLPDLPGCLLRGSYWIDSAECQAMIVKSGKGVKLAGLHATFIREGKKIGRRMYAIADRSMVGGAVRLHRLNGGSELVIGEGIESSLSAGIITGLPCWAALDAGNLEKVEIPDQIKRIVIAADNDLSFTGQASAYILAKRLKAAGKSVEVIIPEIQGEDFNDQIKYAN